MIIFQLAEAVVDLKGFGFFFCVQYFCLNSFQILSVVMWSARRQLAQMLLNQKEVAVIFVVCSPIFMFKPSIEYNKPIWNVLQSFQKVCVWKSGGSLRRLLAVSLCLTTSSIQFLYFMRYLAENKDWKRLPLGSVQESFNEHLTWGTSWFISSLCMAASERWDHVYCR